jgi:hypothetical protein
LGVIIDFRCRARDYAGNVEPYPEGAGDTSTHIYHSTILGKVLNIRHQPVLAATAQSTPTALNDGLSDATGTYRLYYDKSDTYEIEVSHRRFGSLPPLHDVSISDTTAAPDLCLPPIDDRIANGGFESGDLSHWVSVGSHAPVLTSTAHTGHYGLLLGDSQNVTHTGIAQTLELSATQSTNTLSLLYNGLGADPETHNLQRSLKGATAAITYTVPLTATGWQHQWWDLSVWKEPTATLQITFERAPAADDPGVIVDEICFGTALQGVFSTYLPQIVRNR